MSEKNLIPLSTGEFAKLIRLSQWHGPVKVHFGSGGGALDAEETPWAVPLLAEWRGETVNNGGGI